MVLVTVSLTETTGKTAESTDQDQAARMCSLILLYTLFKQEWQMGDLTLSKMAKFRLFQIKGVCRQQS